MGVLFKIVLNLISAQNNSAILKEVFDKNTKNNTEFITKDYFSEFKSSPDSCVKCYTMFYHFYLSKLMYFLEE